VHACWEWGCLRVLRASGRLGLIRLPPYGSRHLYDRTLTHPPTVLPASQVMGPARAGFSSERSRVRDSPRLGPKRGTDEFAGEAIPSRLSDEPGPEKLGGVLN